MQGLTQCVVVDVLVHVVVNGLSIVSNTRERIAEPTEPASTSPFHTEFSGLLMHRTSACYIVLTIAPITFCYR